LGDDVGRSSEPNFSEAPQRARQSALVSRGLGRPGVQSVNGAATGSDRKRSDCIAATIGVGPARPTSPTRSAYGNAAVVAQIAMRSPSWICQLRRPSRLSSGMRQRIRPQRAQPLESSRRIGTRPSVKRPGHRPSDGQFSLLLRKLSIENSCNSLTVLRPKFGRDDTGNDDCSGLFRGVRRFSC
jgi:hypothetical protein